LQERRGYECSIVNIRLVVRSLELIAPTSGLGCSNQCDVSNIELITKNEELNDPIIVDGEIECEYQRIGQPSLVVVAIDACGCDTVPVMLYYLDDVHRQFFAYDVARCPFSDGLLSPVIAQLVVNQRIVCERGQYPFEVEVVGRLDVGCHQRRKRAERDLRKAGRRHGMTLEFVEYEWLHCTSIAADGASGALYFVKT